MKKEKRTNKFIKRIAKLLALLLLVVFLLLLFIRSPWGQGIIVDKFVSFLTEKTGTHITVDKLFITFSGDLEIQGVYLEDLQKDTLLYAKNLQADIAISPFIFNKKIKINELEWNGVLANVTRSKNTEKFNFSFLLDAFVTPESKQSEDTTEVIPLDIGSISLTKFKVNYVDKFLGIESKNRIGSLYTEFETIQMEELLFHINRLELSNSSISYIQHRLLPASNEDTSSTLPQLVFSNIALENVDARYHSIPDRVLADINVDQLTLDLPKIDIATNTYEIDGLAIANSKILFELPQRPESSTEEMGANASNSFVWPDYHINARNLTLKDSQFSLNKKTIDTVKNKFNPNSFDFSEVEFRAKTVSYTPKQVNLDVEQLSFKENSDLHLNQFSVKGTLNENQLRLSNLVFKTSRSSLYGAARLNYSSIQNLIDSPKDVVVALDISFFSFDARDLYIFEPSLQANEVLTNISEKPFTGQLFAQGTLDEIALENTALKWGSQSSLKLKGTVYNSTNVDSLRVDFDSIIATTVLTDLNRFITLRDSTLTFPKRMQLNGTASGSLKNLSTNINLKSSMGDASFIGSGGLTTTPFIEGLLTIDSLQLGNLLNNPQFKDISLTVDAKVKGTDLETLTGQLDATITEFYWNNYLFANLSANAIIDQGTGEISLDYKDKNLNLSSLTALKLDNAVYNIETSIDVIGANLNALRSTENDIRVGANIKAAFLGTTEAYTINTKITKGVSTIENNRFQTGDIDISASVSQNATEATITSEFLNGGLKANGSPNQISKALLIQFENYFNDSPQFISQTDSILVNLNANLTPKPILTEVLLRGIERMDTIRMNASFDSAKRDLHAELQLPFAEYKGGTVDSLNFMINGDSSDLKFSFGINALRYNPLLIKKTYLDGVLKNKKLELDFISFDDEEKLTHIASEMQFRRDTLSLRINPEELTINKKPWSIPENNLVVFAANFLSFQDIILTRNNQEIQLSDAVGGVTPNHIGLLFKNFKLQTFLSLLNPDEALGTGIVQGNLILENPFAAAGVLADIEINNLGILENQLGNLSLNASSQELSKYTVDLAIKEGPITMDLTGNYKATATGPYLDLYLDLKKLETSFVTGFFKKEFTKPTGFLSGQFELQGTLNKPSYEGNLTFHETGLKIIPLNTQFKVDDETIAINESTVIINDFEIEDSKGDTFKIDGSMGVKQLLNPTFDLNFTANEFRLLDSSKEDNALYFGTASIDADVRLSGNLSLPKVDGKLKIGKLTELTYVVPEEQLDIEERDGVVIFVNRENPDAILTTKDERSAPDLLQGFDVNLLLEVADDAVLSLILDERSGDVLQVAGDATLNLNLNPNGSIGLTGSYELKEGYYSTNLYNLVSRKFDIAQGSTIRWQGDPMDAKLDVTAIYKLETSAAPLMASETSGVETSLAAKYQKVMPFLVYLNVDGEITAPEISFNLDMPTDSKGDLGGAIYAKVRQLNEQETELNKQVFSLLALNRFFPNTISDGSTGGAAWITRNNVNMVLSNGLNSFSESLLGNSGFELDFDLDSFTDYTGESAQDRTQLNIKASKKLFNERLIVTAGSAVDVEGSAQTGQEETPIIGNVSLEYLLTKNGRYRLKGFQKNEYVNEIDGQLMVTGLALIFNREFNALSELFNPLKNDTVSNPKKRNKTKKSKKETNDE